MVFPPAGGSTLRLSRIFNMLQAHSGLTALTRDVPADELAAPVPEQLPPDGPEDWEELEMAMIDLNPGTEIRITLRYAGPLIALDRGVKAATQLVDRQLHAEAERVRQGDPLFEYWQQRKADLDLAREQKHQALDRADAA